MMVVGISGQAGSGKDTVADMLVDNHDFMKVSLADPIKVFARTTFKFTQQQLWGASNYRNDVDERFQEAEAWERARERVCAHAEGFAASLFGDEPMMAAAAAAALPAWFDELRAMTPDSLSPRIVLQSLGTEFGRRLDPDIWIRQAFKVLKELDTAAVISDIRFRNELEYIRSHGGFVVRVKRKATDNLSSSLGITNHPSEVEQTSLQDHEFNFVINNDRTLTYLEAEVERIADVVEVIKAGRVHAKNSNP